MAGENIMKWLRKLLGGESGEKWWLTAQAKEDWNRAFDRSARPVLDRYLRGIVEKTAYRGKQKASRQEIDSLITSIRGLVRPVVNSESEEAWYHERNVHSDAELAKHLAPYVEQFLRYPFITYALLGYESISRISFTAGHLWHLEYIVARIMHHYAPESYDTTKDMFNGLDAITIAYIRKLEGYQDVAGTLQRCRIDLIGVLYQLALPADENWPDKRQEVSRWAKTYLESIRKWGYANNESNLAYDVGGYLGELERKQRYSK